MVLKDDVIAQSALSISESCQSGFLALLAKFDLAIPCTEKYVFVHCLLPEELDASTKPMNPGGTKKHASTVLKPNIWNICNSISNSFSEMIEKIKEIKSKVSEQQDNHLSIRKSSINTLDHVVIDDSVRHCCTKSKNGHKGPSSQSCKQDENDYCAQQFPHFNIVDSASFENSTDLSSSLHQSSKRQWLESADSNPVLHPPLQRVWLASFIPDGFWPQLLAKIVLDDAICNTLTTVLSTALKSDEYTLKHTNSDAASLWKLSQLGLAVEYDEIKLVELVQTTNMCDNSSDKHNLSEQYSFQIELKINIRDIVLVRKQETSDIGEDSKIDIVRLTTRILVMIEQHLLDIGEEWFPGTISDSRSQQILSFVPCSLCVSRNDDDTSYADCAGCLFLHCGGCKVVCFSLKQLLVAYASPSRSVKCPLHGDMLIRQLAPDMVSSLYMIVHAFSRGLILIVF